MVANPVDHRSNKHVKIARHYTHELTEEKIIVNVWQLRTTLRIITKSPPESFFQKFSCLLLDDPSNADIFFFLSVSTDEQQTYDDCADYTADADKSSTGIYSHS